MKVKHFHIRLNKEYLHQDEETLNAFMQTVSVKNTAMQLVTLGQDNYWSILVFYGDVSAFDENDEIVSKKQASFDPSTLNEEERSRYEILRRWRAEAAAKDNYPNYIVASNVQLGVIAKLNPSTTEELLKVKGLGARKVEKYGTEIIAVLNSN
jgi:superfamily II DNA helicase RecQ